MFAATARRPVLALIAAVCSIAALPACGEGDDAEKKITEMLTAGLTTEDPAVICKQTLSTGLVQRVYGGATKCLTVERADAKTSKPASAVEVSGIKVDGAGGAAFVEVKGGDQDGARGELRVAKQGDDWRLDDLSTELLRSQFKAGVRNDRQLNSSLRSCISSKVLALDDAGFRSLGYGAMGEQPKALAELNRYVAECATQLSGSDSGSGDASTASVLRKQFEQGIAESLQKDGLPTAAIECVKRKLRGALSDKQIVSLIGKGSSDVPPEIASATAGALAACAATK